MERRFDMSDFEKSLKDHADQFKMTPSKRVWNGIYNNLHPGSKWPSATVALVFVITLVTIGSLNNSTKHSVRYTNPTVKPATNTSQQEIQRQSHKEFAFESNTDSKSSISNLKKNKKALFSDKGNVEPTNISDKISSSPSLSIVANHLSGKKKARSKIENRLLSSHISIKAQELQVPDVNTSALSTANEQNLEISFLQQSVKQQSDIQLPSSYQKGKFITEIFTPVSYQTFSIPSSEWFTERVMPLDQIKTVFLQFNILNEHTVVKGKKINKKKNNNIEWMFYVNPTISTVIVNKKTIEPSNNSSSIVVLSNQPSFNLIHNPRFGLETGTEMSWQFAKKLKLVTGLNLRYSGYNNVSNLVHPTFATLNLNNNKGGTYSKTYITHYGNGQSQDHINLVNYNVEASIPVGIQYNIWGSQKIKIDLSSMLEPSVILRDNAFFISSDGRYYVNDPSLVRRTNLDGHFGSYITFIGKKIKWHLGPDVRYQLFSTYKNIYPTKEHSIDYGIRIGISK